MARTLAKSAVLLASAVALSTLTAPLARAQEVSARDRQAAGEAYDWGTAAYMAHDYPGAARWFETAYRLAPAGAALVQAIRAYEHAGNDLRAANLGLRLSALYPNAGQRDAERALRNAPHFFRVDVECEDCTVQLDGAVMGYPSFFVEPDADHVVEAAFETGSQRETVNGPAGEQTTLRFEAPPPPPPDQVATTEAATQTSEGTTAATQPLPPPSDDPIPLGWTITAMVATAALGGVLAWSIVDMYDGVPAYEANPTAAALADGQSRELRTDILIGATAAVGVATLVMMFFTDWDNAPPAAPQVSFDFSIQPSGGTAGLRGRF